MVSVCHGAQWKNPNFPNRNYLVRTNVVRKLEIRNNVPLFERS